MMSCWVLLDILFVLVMLYFISYFSFCSSLNYDFSRRSQCIVMLPRTQPRLESGPSTAVLTQTCDTTRHRHVLSQFFSAFAELYLHYEEDDIGDNNISR